MLQRVQQHGLALECVAKVSHVSGSSFPSDHLLRLLLGSLIVRQRDQVKIAK